MSRSSRISSRRRHVLDIVGDAALAAVLRRRPLLGFDFDGTLAPIVPLPHRARISRCVSTKLRQLAEYFPVAVVSSRSTADLVNRLDCAPCCILGNHGADLNDSAALHAFQSLKEVRKLLAAHEAILARAGITVEDKALSIALHYRLSRHPDEARSVMRGILHGIDDSCRMYVGKMVVNIVPAGLPDKAGAMHKLVRESGATCAFFVGDDVSDEPVFACAPDDWLTVRIGRDAADSRAHYFLDCTAEVGMLLDRLISLTRTHPLALAPMADRAVTPRVLPACR